MIRRLCASLLAVGALAAPASAATFAELPVTVMDTYTGCLQTTGTPGELALSGIGADGVQLLRADRTGVTRTQTLSVPSCSTVVGRPNGAGVAAGGSDSTVVAAVRDPGGAWSVPLDLDYPTSNWNVTATAAAVSDRGDAVVAWVEHTFKEPERMRVRVARRAPGAGFGEPQTLATGANEIQDVQAGVAANGDAFVLWTTKEGAFAPHRNVVRVANAPAGQPLGAPTIVGTMPWRSDAALAVAQDGQALVALRQARSMMVVERPPGGTFGGPTFVGTADDAVGVVAQAVIEDGGRAAIAWRGIDSAGARLVSRPVAGPFSPPVQLVEDLAPERDADPFYATESFAKVSGYIGSAARRRPHAHARRAGGLRGRGRRPAARRRPGEREPVHAGARRRWGATRNAPATVRLPAGRAGVPARRRHAGDRLHRGRRAPSSTCTSPRPAPCRRPTDRCPRCVCAARRTPSYATTRCVWA